MAQHDYSIANQTAPSLRTDLNNALSAIVSHNSGTTAPSTTYANMIWYDTTNDILKMRNETNTAWIELFDLDQGSNLASPSNIASQAEAEAGTNTSKMMTPQRVSQAIDALAPQVLEGWHPYDMVTAGDGNDGVFWDHSIDGDIVTPNWKETPSFNDGYDYAILGVGLSSGGSLFGHSLQVGLYGATSAAWVGTVTIDSSFLSTRSSPTDYFVEFVTPTRYPLNRHGFSYTGPTSGITSQTITTAQKIGKMRVQLSDSAATIDAGKLILLKKRNYLTG